MYTGYRESHERRGNVGRNASGEKLPGETTEAGRERELELASADGGWVARVWLAPVAGGSRG